MPSSSPRSRMPLLAALSFLLAACSSPAPEQAEPDRAEPPAPASATSEETGEAVPVIASDEATFDFGTVAPSGSVTHVFKLQNRGTADLHIEKVERT